MKLLYNIFLFFLIVFLFSALTKNIFDYRKNLRFYQSYKKEYELEKKENISLKTQILKKNDPDELEKTIRNKLNLSKPNEVTLIIPNPAPTPAVITPTPLPNWQRWYEVFFKN